MMSKKHISKTIIAMALIVVFVISSIPVSAATAPYRITFDVNDGKQHANLPSVLVAPGESNAFVWEVPYRNPAKKGYVFMGWNTKANGEGKMYRPGSFVKMTAEKKNMTLHAIWKKGNCFAIRYYGQGGTSIPPETIVASTSTKATTKISKKVPKKAGYEFKCWNTEKNGKGTSYDPNTKLRRSQPGQIKLYAIWEKATLFTLAFNTNGGTAMDPVEVYSKKKSYRLYIPSTTPTRSGYTFECWNSKRDGSGKDYYPGGSLVRLATKPRYTLFAQWTKNGSPSQPVVTPTPVVIDPDPVVTPTPEPTVAPEPSVTPTPTPAPVVYTYRLILDPYGGSVDKNSYEEKSTNENYGIRFPNVTPTLPGYNFVQWNTNPDGTGTTYSAGDMVHFTSDNRMIRIYAVWEKKQVAPTPTPVETVYTYSLRFDANGGANAPSNITAESTKTTYSLKINDDFADREGYTLKGWSTSKDGSGNLHHRGDSINVSSANPTAVLYAVWEKQKVYSYKIILDANGGSGSRSIEEQSTELTATLHFPDDIPTREGYLFKGWNSKKDGSGVKYTSGSVVNLSSSNNTATAYAIWEKQVIVTPTPVSTTYEYTVNFNANGGNNAPAAIVKKSTETSVNITITNDSVTRDGYLYQGWNTKADGSGLYYNLNSVITLTSMNNTVTLYAIWEKLPTEYTYTLKFDANGGVNPPAAINKKSKGTSILITIAGADPTRDGYVFNGWNTNKQGTGNTYYYDMDVKVTSSAPTVTLYAMWEKVTAPVTPTPEPTPEPTPTPGIVDKETTFTLKFKNKSAYLTGMYMTATSKTSTYTFTIPNSGEDYIEGNENFSGWNTKSDGSGTNYMTGDTVTVSADNPNVWLFARFDKIVDRKFEKKVMPIVDGGFDEDGGMELLTGHKYFYTEEDAKNDVNEITHVTYKGKDYLYDPAKGSATGHWRSHTSCIDLNLLASRIGDTVPNAFGVDSCVVNYVFYSSNSNEAIDKLREFNTASDFVNYYIYDWEVSRDYICTEKEISDLNTWANMIDSSYAGWDYICYGNQHKVVTPLHPELQYSLASNYATGIFCVVDTIEVWARVE